MFEYAIKELNKKLEKLENKYEKTALESEKMEEKTIKLQNYLIVMSDFIDSNILLVIFFAAFCMSLLVAAGVGVSILYAVICIVEGGMIVANRKIMKKNYSEFLHGKKLFHLKDQLQEQAAVINEIKDQVLSEVNECNKELQKVNELKDEPVNLLVVSQNPYYLANTEEEYYKFNEAKNNGVNNLLNVYWDIFLEEKINPVNVRYNNKIGNTIQYTENNKSLIKKM